MLKPVNCNKHFNQQLTFNIQCNKTKRTKACSCCSFSNLLGHENTVSSFEKVLLEMLNVLEMTRLSFLK